MQGLHFFDWKTCSSACCLVFQPVHDVSCNASQLEDGIGVVTREMMGPMSIV